MVYHNKYFYYVLKKTTTVDYTKNALKLEFLKAVPLEIEFNFKNEKNKRKKCRKIK